jgi:hypothetical protein
MSTTEPPGNAAATLRTAAMSSLESMVPAYTSRGAGSVVNQVGGAGGSLHSDGSTPFGTTVVGPAGRIRSMIGSETAQTAWPCFLI